MQTTPIPTREEVQSFVYSLFRGTHSVRGETEGQLVTPQTPIHDCFHLDVDGIDHDIGKPIGQRFDIMDMGVAFGIPSHSYDGLGDQERTFYRKYPLKHLPTEKFTLERFANMMYDLVRIKNRQRIESL